MQLFFRPKRGQGVNGADEPFPGGATQPTDPFTVLGLAIAMVGWALLIAALVLSDALLKSGSLVAIISLRSDIVTVAQTAILSGFALALIGALRRGFGALNRFFDAVLQRSSTPRPSPTIREPADAPEPMPDVRPDLRPAEHAGQTGRIRDRNYVILPDGSVEVETMLGTRVFATLDEARDFIR